MGRSPYKYKIKLSGKEKRELRQARRKGCKKARLVIRILIVLLADAAKKIAETATILGCCEQTVLNQRKRGHCCFARFAPFRPSSGLYGPAAGADYGHGSATLHEHDLPLSRFSVADLLRVVRQEDGLANLSHSNLARHLRQDALKPWQYRYWLFPRDPDFVSKTCVVLDLYAGFWEGQPLSSSDHVLCADEKNGLQILRRCHPSRPAIPSQLMQVRI